MTTSTETAGITLHNWHQAFDIRDLRDRAVAADWLDDNGGDPVEVAILRCKVRPGHPAEDTLHPIVQGGKVVPRLGACPHRHRAYAEVLRACGQGEKAERFARRAEHLENPLSEGELARLRRHLDEANGRRRIRTLSLRDCLEVAREAIIEGYSFVGGGTVANSYGYASTQTICVAACRNDGSVRIEVGTNNATKGSSRTRPLTGLNENAPGGAFWAWANRRGDGEQD